MALKQELMASSLPAAAASKLGVDTLTSITPAGSTQGTATALSSNFVTLATASAGGVIISQTHAMHMIINASGNTQTIYPPVGSAMNNGTVNAGVTLANSARMLIMSAGTQFFTITSA